MPRLAGRKSHYYMLLHVVLYDVPVKSDLRLLLVSSHDELPNIRYLIKKLYAVVERRMCVNCRN